MTPIQTKTSEEERIQLFRQLLAGVSLASEYVRCAFDLQLQGKFDEAKMVYEQALGADSRNVYALNNLGQLLLQRQEVEGALPFLRRAVELEPGYALAHNNLGNAYFQMGLAEEALGQYREAADADATYSIPHRNLALALHLLGRRDEAVEEYRTYFCLAPAGTKDADAHFNLGVMLEEGGNVDEAVEEYARALADDPRHLKALNNLGLVHFSRGEMEEAA